MGGNDGCAVIATLFFMPGPLVVLCLQRAVMALPAHGGASARLCNCCQLPFCFPIVLL
ncbi:hypothetical protein HMPREF6485_0157 [Segatella buccae ATCC 33574]|uniref:Uncharacterized protein n=1 Tax=Segatella buccae ATCC 33574 TaxID=873513 RepID=E6K3K4_9BACT|nr:hypothetical protein HMPREF6485_0157 [Segatella buccae ATCC 33574]